MSFLLNPCSFWCVVLQKVHTPNPENIFGCWWNPAGFMPFSEVIAVVYRGDNHMGFGIFISRNKITACIFCIWSCLETSKSVSEVLKAVSQTEAPPCDCRVVSTRAFPMKERDHFMKQSDWKKKNMQCDTLVKPEFRIVPSMILQSPGVYLGAHTKGLSCQCHPLAGQTATSVKRCRSKRFEAMSRCESADVYLRAWACINQKIFP